VARFIARKDAGKHNSAKPRDESRYYEQLPMRYLECKGTAYEIGHQQGEALRELIHERWKQDVQPILARLQGQQPGVDARIAKAHAQTLDFLSLVTPAIVEEIRGVADGAKIPFEQVLFMNTYNSLVFHEQISELGGCSALAFCRSPVGPFVFKTYDPFGSKEIDSPEQRRKKAEKENRWLYVLRAEYRGGLMILGVRIAGSVWTECGVNDRGLAFASASMHPRLYPQRASAFPQHFVGTLAVNRCGSVAAVKTVLAKAPVYGKGYASSYTDVTGDAVGTEKTAGFTGFNAPASDTVAFQTNHIRSPELVRLGREQDPKFWEGNYHRNSSNRVRHIESRLPKWREESRFDSLVEDLFHAGSEGDLIQNCTEMNQHWITTWGALVFPQTKELWLAEGLPEERRFQKWKL